MIGFFTTIKPARGGHGQIQTKPWGGKPVRTVPHRPLSCYIAVMKVMSRTVAPSVPLSSQLLSTAPLSSDTV